MESEVRTIASRIARVVRITHDLISIPPRYSTFFVNNTPRHCMLRSLYRASTQFIPTLHCTRPSVSPRPTFHHPALIRTFKMSAPVEANLQKDEVTGEMVSKS